MARFAVIDPRTQPQAVGIAGKLNPSDAFSGGLDELGKAAEGLGNLLGRIAEREQAAEDAAFVSEASGALSREAVSLLETAKRGPTETTVDSSGARVTFDDRVMQQFDTMATARLEAAPSDDARALLSRRLETLRTGLFQDAVGFRLAQEDAQRLQSLEGALDDLANVAYASPEKLPQLLAQAQGDLDAAAATHLSPEQAGKHSDKIDSVLAEAAMRGRIERDPAAALKALAPDEEAPSDPAVALLTPARRETLAGAARAELTRRRVEANAARAEVREELNAIGDLVKRGYDPGADRLAAAATAAAATGDAKLTAKLAAIEDTRAFMTAARREDPVALQDWINGERARLNAKGSVNEREADRVDAAETLLGEMTRGLEQDPVSWANRVGLVAAQPLFQPGQAADPAAMRARRDQALAVAEHYGVAPRMLTDEESGRLGSQLAAAGPDAKLQMFGAIREGFGAYTPDVLREVAADDPVSAQAAGLFVFGEGQQRVTARAALAGQEIVKGGNASLPAKADQDAAVAETLGTAAGSLSRTHNQIIETAKALYAAEAQRRGLPPNAPEGRDLFAEMLQKAAGRTTGRDGRDYGGIAEYNGAQVLIPAELAADDFADRVQALTDQQLVDGSVGWGPPLWPGESQPIAAEQLRSLYLVPRADGQYQVALSDPALGEPDFARDPGAPGGIYVLDIRTAFAAARAGRRIGERAP